jgi:hypothetical protein
MSERFLIKNTTREQRAEIVRRSLSCGGGGCEDCKACGAYGATMPCGCKAGSRGKSLSSSDGGDQQTQCVQ